MSERTDHPPSTNGPSGAPTPDRTIRRAIVGGLLGLALQVGPVALATVVLPDGTGAGGGSGPPTWRDLTRLHPASSVAATRWSGLGLGPDADALADATRALAGAWPWSRLRADPAVVDVPGPLPDPPVVAWMDDGMWARWLLAAFPVLADLVDAACSLLTPNLAQAVKQVVEASIGRVAPVDTPEEHT